MNPLQLISAFLPIIDRVLPTKPEQDKAKAELITAVSESDVKEWDAKSKVLSAEMQGEDPLQRRWRPHLMYLFMVIIGMNYIVLPLLNVVLVAFGQVVIPDLPIPEHMWYLIDISVGGYVVGRSAEKYASIKNGAMNSIDLPGMITNIVNTVVKKR